METLSIFLALVSFITGACIGSFLNVVIFRLPRDLSVNKPKRSFCPNCKYRIPSYFNIPLFSWLILKGKCKNCGAKVSGQYFLVELLTAILFLIFWFIYGGDLQGNLYNTISLVLPGWLFIALIISASFIDFEHQIIKFFPMGRDFRSIQDFNNGSSLERTKLCYCNYSMNTHPVRETIYQHIQDKSFIEFEHMGNFLDYQVSREHFFKCLFSSKFTICPRGNACDTFRFYDAIYCGCIPIVVKMPYHHHFDNLPVLFLSHEDDFKELTQEKLEEKYNELSLKHLSYYPELDLEYWLNSIKNDFIISQV